MKVILRKRRIKPPLGAPETPGPDTLEGIGILRDMRSPALQSALGINGGNGARAPAELRERAKRR